jgi:hypothetical protein
MTNIREREHGQMDAPGDGAEPSQEQIRLRAYEIYLSHGDAGSCAQDDWLQAERELRQRLRAERPSS